MRLKQVSSGGRKFNSIHGVLAPYLLWLEDVLWFLRIIQQWVSLTPRHQVICRPLLLVDKRLLLTSLGHVSVEIECSFVKR